MNLATLPANSKKPGHAQEVTVLALPPLHGKVAPSKTET